MGFKKYMKFDLNYWRVGSRKLAFVAATVMLASAVVRASYFILSGLAEFTPFELATQLALPLACNIIFACEIYFLKDKALWITCIPVAFGSVFFIIKSIMYFTPLHMALCCALYVGAFVLYTITVCGLIRITTLVKLVFGLPFIYHIFVEDLPVLISKNPPRTAVEWMPEISVLLIMISLFTAVSSFEKREAGGNTRFV